MTTIHGPLRIYKDIDFNFPKHPATFDVGKKVDINAVKQSIVTLVCTRFGERPFQPDLGSLIMNMLFEPVDPITLAVMKSGIEQVIQNHEPRCVVQDIEIFNNNDSTALDISIYFSVVGIALPASFTFTLQRLR